MTVEPACHPSATCSSRLLSPLREVPQDADIDLAVRDEVRGGWTAFPRRFSYSKHHPQKADIGPFFSARGKCWDGVAFDNRMIPPPRPVIEQRREHPHHPEVREVVVTWPTAHPRGRRTVP